jgi:hypothetical protein
MKLNRAILVFVGTWLPSAGIGCSSAGHAPVGAPDLSGSGGRAVGAGGTRGGSDASVDGDAGAGGSGASSGGSAAGGSAGKGGSTGAGGEPDAGCPTASAPATERGTAVCLADAAWGSSQAVATTSTPDNDVFGSITPNELTIAWMAMAGDTPTLYYADRASPDDPFYPAGTLAPGYYAAERPALSADGQRIVVVRADRKGFAEYTRTGVFGSFTSSPSEASFMTLNGLGGMLLSSAYFGDPMLSSDDKTFYYSRYDGRSPNTVFAGSRTALEAWPAGSPVAGAPLIGGCSRRRRPTGISSDDLTLFYWDEFSGTERATFRPSVGAPFVGVVDLGSRDRAQPNASCQRLYYSPPASGVVFASR